MGYETICLIFIVLLMLYYWATLNLNYWKDRNIPYVKPLPFFGNILPLIKGPDNFHSFLQSIYDHTPEARFIGYFMLNEPILLIKDPSLISDIMIKSFNHFYDRDVKWLFRPGDKKLNPLSDHIFSTFGPRWKFLRQSMSHFFTSGKLKYIIFEQINQCADILDKELATKPVVDVEELFIKFTTDVIAACAFGVRLNTLQNKDKKFTDTMRKAFASNAGLKFVILSFHKKILDFIGYSDFSAEVTQFFVTLVRDVIQCRERGQKKNDNLMDILIDIKNDSISCKELSNEDTFDDLDIIANTFLMFVAGFETTATIMTRCVYELALHQEIQDELRREVDNSRKTKDGNISIDYLNELEYLDMVISETLRKYPAAPVFNRICTIPYTIPDTNITLKKGSKVSIPTLPVHRDPKYYPDPEKFDPQRFSSENKAKMIKGTYFPFGDGPKNCIGKRLALMILKVAIAKMVARYEISPCEKMDVPLRLLPKVPFLKSVNGVHLRISKIK